jgi:hypothetical protein
MEKAYSGIWRREGAVPFRKTHKIFSKNLGIGSMRRVPLGDNVPGFFLGGVHASTKVDSPGQRQREYTRVTMGTDRRHNLIQSVPIFACGISSGKMYSTTKIEITSKNRAEATASLPSAAGHDYRHFPCGILVFVEDRRCDPPNLII